MPRHLLNDAFRPAMMRTVFPQDRAGMIGLSLCKPDAKAGEQDAVWRFKMTPEQARNLHQRLGDALQCHETDLQHERGCAESTSD